MRIVHIAWGMAFILTGCQNLPDSGSMPSASLPVVDAPCTLCQDRWWLAFNDEVLNALLVLVQAQNLESKIADLQLQKSLLLLQKNQENFSLAWQARSDIGGTLDERYSQTQSHLLGLQASWELDFWGKNALNQRAQVLEFQASGYEHNSLKLAMYANAVRAYFMLINANQKIDDNRASLAYAQAQLKFAHARLQAGQIAKADILPLQESINQHHQSAVSLQNQRHDALQTIALLANTPIAHLPKALTEQKILPKIPMLASNLDVARVQYRPDLQAGLARLKVAQDAPMLAQKNAYPTLVFNASANRQGMALVDLIKIPVLNWGVSLNLPTLNVREHNYAMRASENSRESAILQFQDSLHKALLDVQSKIMLYQASIESQKLAIKQKKLRTQQVMYQKLRLENGLIAPKDYVDSVESERQAKMALQDAHLAQALAYVALYQAMGGF